MDVNAIVTLVGSLGFPIVACIFVAIYCSKTQDSYRADIKEMNNTHKAEMDKMTEAINNNTMVIQKLIDKLDKDGD